MEKVVGQFLVVGQLSVSFLVVSQKISYLLSNRRAFEGILVRPSMRSGQQAIFESYELRTLPTDN